jgi:hypothetical protein
MALYKDWLPQNHEALHDMPTRTMNYLGIPASRDTLYASFRLPSGFILPVSPHF